MKKIIMLLIVGIFFSTLISAQMSCYKYGEKLYDKLSYFEAIRYFEKALSADSNNMAAIRKLADCYRMTNDTKNAQKYYAKAVQSSEVEPIEKYRYGQVLMQNGEYDEAKKWLKQYNADNRGLVQLRGIEKINSFFKDSSNYKVENYEDVNTSSSEYCPAFFNNNILISSNRFKLDGVNNKSGWTGKDFYKVFEIKNKDNIDVVKFNNKVDAKYNVGPVCFDSKSKKLYVTQNQINDGKVVVSKDKQVKLQIKIFSYVDSSKKWIEEKAFKYNDAEYNVAHAAITKDGKWLVFSSDMPGGQGGMDLWKCKFENGDWSKPENLGANVNTKGNEVFPYISSKDILFFSSNGLEGLGGLDVYLADFKKGNPGKLSTISYPINSRGDDCGFIINESSDSAYFSSNREGGKGGDDIYIAKISKPFITSLAVTGKVTNSKNDAPLDSALVAIFNENGDKLGEVVTRKDGSYSFDVEPNKSYKLVCTRPSFADGMKFIKIGTDANQKDLTSDFSLKRNMFGFFCIVTDKKTANLLEGVQITIKDAKSQKVLYVFNTGVDGAFRQKLDNIRVNDVLDYEIGLNKKGYWPKSLKYHKQITKPGELLLHEDLDASLEAIETGVDIAKFIKINPIYFDLAKSNIRPDAAKELDKLVKFMKENPAMVVEIGSHTDCRGTADKNLKLSDDRAKSSVNYVISKGVQSNRIYGKGYGESKLLNDCGCEGAQKSNCTEEQHQQNRRTEFVIINM